MLAGDCERCVADMILKATPLLRILGAFEFIAQLGTFVSLWQQTDLHFPSVALAVLFVLAGFSALYMFRESCRLVFQSVFSPLFFLSRVLGFFILSFLIPADNGSVGALYKLMWIFLFVVMSAGWFLTRRQLAQRSAT